MSITASVAGLLNDFESNKHLYITSCGIFENSGKPNWCIRENGCKTYQIIISLAGRVIFKIHDRSLILKPNEIIIIPPDFRNEYAYDHSDAIFIHFSGYYAERLLSDYNIEPNKKYKTTNARQLTIYAEKIINELHLKKIGFMNNCEAYLLIILTAIKRGIESSKNNEKTSRLQIVIDDMNANFASKKSCDEYAKMLNISTARFQHLFAENFGISPHKMLLNIRIENAKHFLLETDLSISEIAKQVGYDDALYFSHIFKKHTGFSPKLYRSKHNNHYFPYN